MGWEREGHRSAMGLGIERGADREGEVEREKVLRWEGYRSAMGLGERERRR